MKHWTHLRIRSLDGTALMALRNWLAPFVLVVIVAAIAVLALDLQQQIRRLASSAADNMQWTLGQAEVEILAIEVAALRATQMDLPLEQVRLRYDVFHSRITTLIESPKFAQFLPQQGTRERLSDIRRFRDSWVPVIDGPDAALKQALPRLADEARETRVLVRGITLAGNSFFSRFGDAQRTSLWQSLLRIGFLTVALVTLLAVLSLALRRLASKRDAEAIANRETRERIETILSTSLDAVIVSDAKGTILDFNAVAERIFGYSRAEAVGTDMADLIVPDRYREAHRAGMRRFQRTGARRFIGKGIVQLDALRRDGSVFPVDVSLDHALSPTGEIFVAFLRDISDRVRGEAALKTARDRAIAGEKQKAELLAVMSHEMRTPLNGMLGTLELVDDARLDPRDKRYLRIARDSGKVLLRHVNDVLDISRLDAGKMRPSKVLFDLVALLEDIVDNQTPSARARGNLLVLIPPNPVLHRVHGDPDRLRQILLNFVGNAIKFTRNGRITIEADCADGLENVELRVTDTGIGIAEGDLDRIFADFVTIDSSYGRNASGTGLGLAICQRLATALGGELGAESEPGDGSLFWLRLSMAAPAHRPEEMEEPPIPVPAAPLSPPIVPPQEILLVEDNAINRIVALEMLERDHHKVTQADTGERALHLSALRRFDVILMDISMPGMDGLAVARALFAGDGPNTHTPIVATTAHALPQEVEAFLAAGMRAVVTKPLNLNALRNALAGALGLTRASKGLDVGPGPEAPLIDMAHLAEMRRGLPTDRFVHVHRTLSREMDGFVDALSTGAVTGQDGHAALAREAHRMAGSAGVIGALQLTALLRDIHLAAACGDGVALRDQSPKVGRCWAATQRVLDRLTDTTEPSR